MGNASIAIELKGKGIMIQRLSLVLLCLWAVGGGADSGKRLPWPLWPGPPPEGIKFTDGQYLGKPRIEKMEVYENPDSLVIVYGKDSFSPTEEHVSKKRVKYMLFTHYVIPFVDGVAQEQTGFFKETEYPHSGAILGGLAGLGVGVWQWMESRDSDKAYRLAVAFGLRNEKYYQDRRFRQRTIAVASTLAGIFFTLVATTPETTLKLPDGTVIGLNSTPDRMGFQLAYSW